MVLSYPRGAIQALRKLLKGLRVGAMYYNSGCQYAAQWYLSGSMGPWGPGVLEWSPAPHEGLPSRYIHCTKKHALRVLTAVQ